MNKKWKIVAKALIKIGQGNGKENDLMRCVARGNFRWGVLGKPLGEVDI